MNTGQKILSGAGAAIGFVVSGFNPQGAIIGAQIGLTLGSALFPTTSETEQPSPSGITFTTSCKGTSIAILSGTQEISGNLIWYGNFQKIYIEEDQGGKGGGNTVTSGHWEYSVSFAVGLCMAPENARTSLLSVKVGTTAVSPSSYTFYDGSQTAPDSHIQAIKTAEGKTRFPVWKNMSYIVFPNYYLGTSPYVPSNLKFEVSSLPVDTGYVWEEKATAAGATIIKLLELDGELYAITYTMLLLKWDNINTWIQMAPAPGTASAALAGVLFSGKIYMSTMWPAYLYEYNGTDAWVQVAPDAGAYTYCEFLCEYAGELYGERSQAGSPTLRKWNGVDDWIDITTMSGEGAIIAGLEFDDKLFLASFPNGKLYTYNGSLLAQVAGQYAPGVGITSLVELNGEIYGLTRDFYGSARNSMLLKWDKSSSWLLVAPSADPLQSAATNPDALKIFNGKIYTGTVGNGELYEWNGVDNWVKVISQLTEIATIALIVYGNYLYAGTASYGALYKWGYPAGEILDVYPTTVTKQILTNPLIGLGFDKNTYLNLTDYAATEQYCADNDLMVSFYFNTQMSILDILQKVINHHNGFITYSDGKISHRQLKTETPIATLTCPGDLVIKKDELPVTFTKPGARDCYNKTTVEYVKRYDADGNATYTTAPASDSDPIDIKNHGIHPQTISLEGLMTHERAAKMASLMLYQSLFNPATLQYTLGPKSLGIRPGAVYALTYARLEYNELVHRITSVSEKSNDSEQDSFTINIEAREEPDGLYDLRAYSEDTAVSTTIPDLYAAASSVIAPIALEIPAQYAYDKELIALSYSMPDEIQWAGTSIYRAWSSGGSYTRLDTVYKTGVTGVVSSVTIANDIATVTVVLDWDYTLSSATDFDDLMSSPRKNLCAFIGTYGAIFVRFEEATLVSGNTWELTGLIYDTCGVPKLNTYGEITATDVFVFYNNIPYLHDVAPADVNRTFYYKIASINFKGEEQDLSAVTAVSIAPEGFVSKPLPPYPISVNGFGFDDNNTVVITPDDLEIVWLSRNRRNEGGNNYSYADAIQDDYDFVTFSLEIYSGSALLRTVTQTTKTYTYTAADQTTDGAIYPLICKLYQKGASDISDAYEFTIAEESLGTDVKLMLRMQGPDGSTNFVDSSIYGNIVTTYGDAQIDTSQYHSGVSSGFFDGVGDYLIIPDASRWHFASSDFLIKCWAYLNEAMGTGRCIAGLGGGASNWEASGHEWVIYLHTDGRLYFQYNKSLAAVNIISTNPIAIASGWHDLKIERVGNTITQYIDDVSVGSGTETGAITTISGGTPQLVIGAIASFTPLWHGWIQDFEID